MPTKYKESAVRVDRQTKKVSIEHFYVKQISQKEAFELLNNANTKPKVKQKIRNELVRRGIKIVKVPKTYDT
tara:strand:- start:316 stop:531 length:216 start_codon:yes stop_codon:yes gene_type:complete